MIIILNQSIGKHSIVFKDPVYINAWASVTGKKESEGPLARYFDKTSKDTRFGEKTWEMAERKMQDEALKLLLSKANIQKSNLGAVLSGDLLNQCISSAFALRNADIPHLGLYGACSTMAEAMLIGAIMVGGGFRDNVVAMTSSHFAASERQYRFPLGYGGQRTPTSQWTVTGTGAVLLSQRGNGPKITACTIGTVKDLGIADANNMGCAMAPAALETIKNHLQDLNIGPDYYDLIITGDLGLIGKEALLSMALKDDLSLGGRLIDCGTMIFDPAKQDTHAGGSGCGCSASVLCSYYLNKLKKGTLKRILFCGTGALLSPTSVQQKLPIAGICHAVAISGGQTSGIS